MTSREVRLFELAPPPPPSREFLPFELPPPPPTTPSSLISGTSGAETDIADVKLAKIARAKSASGFGSVEVYIGGGVEAPSTWGTRVTGALGWVGADARRDAAVEEEEEEEALWEVVAFVRATKILDSLRPSSRRTSMILQVRNKGWGQGGGRRPDGSGWTDWRPKLGNCSKAKEGRERRCQLRLAIESSSELIRVVKRVCEDSPS